MKKLALAVSLSVIALVAALLWSAGPSPAIGSGQGPLESADASDRGYRLDDETRTWFAQSAAAVEPAAASRWPEAARAFEQIVERHPENAYAVGRAASSWLEAREYERALAAYRRAREFHALALPAMIGTARSCAALGRDDCAFEWLERFRAEDRLDLSTLLETAELRRLHRDPRFAELIEELKASAPPPSSNRFAWSPDGRKLLTFSRLRPEHGRQFHVIDLGSDETTQIGRFDDELVAGYDWSPDGEWIVLSRYRLFPWMDNLYLMRIDGSELRPLLPRVDQGEGVARPLAGRAMGPSWSHDGRRITFVRGDAGDGYQVYVVNRDGSGLTPLTSSAHYKENARFTTGDERVCYDVPPVNEPDGESSYDIRCVATDGSGETEVLRDDGWWYDANWATSLPLYAATYWHSNNSRFGRAVLVDERSGELTVLTAPDVDAWHAAPSADGSWVAFSAARHAFGNRRCLFVIRSDGTDMRPAGPLGNCLDG